MLLEYEGKALLRAVGIRVPDGLVIRSSDELEPALRTKGLSYPVAVKAQVESGGRGKAGGVIRADTEQMATDAVQQLLRSRVGSATPSAVLIERWLPHTSEMYLSVTVDGAAEGYVVLFSDMGGVDVEQGGRLLKYPIGAPSRFRAHELRAALQSSNVESRMLEKVIGLAQLLVATAAARDCTTIEINPLVEFEGQELVALDAKVVVDESAVFRNRTIFEHRQRDRDSAPELLRACLHMRHNYVPLEGDIGLISGGAGMTMAAMDLIQSCGGRPACFLDCSPGPTSPRGYRPAFALLDSDPNVRVILVSVYGGGTQMQLVANAMKEVMRERKSRKPVVFRLNGTNVDQVPGIFAEFGAKNHALLEDAVNEAIALARQPYEYSA